MSVDPVPHGLNIFGSGIKIKDWIAVGDMTLKHCLTESMLADHFTKPLQGSVFRKFQAEIQGIPADTVDADLCWDRTYEYVVPSPQECVVGNGIPMEPALQDNGREAEGGLKEGLTKGQTNRVIGPMNHGAMNYRGNIWAIKSYADAVKCPRKG